MFPGLIPFKPRRVILVSALLQVPLALLEGRVFGVVWPPARARIVDSSVQHGREIVYRG